MVSLKKPVYENMVLNLKPTTKKEMDLHIKVRLVLFVSSPEALEMTPCLQVDPTSVNVGPGA